MARRVVMIDDLDGSEGAQTIAYGFEGQEFEIDLSPENAEKFRSMMRPYIASSRPRPRQPFSHDEEGVESDGREAILARLRELRSSKEELDAAIREVVRRAVAVAIPYRSIGAQLGVSAQTIHNWIVESAQ